MLKNILFILFVAIVLQACGGKDIDYQAELDLICESQSFDSDGFKVKSIHYGMQLNQLEVKLATLKGDYSSDDVCIPFSVVVTNTGTDPLYLTGEQLTQLNDNVIGFYSQGTRLFDESFLPAQDNSILNGEPWLPGAQLEFAAFIYLDRIKLYTPPNLAEATKVWNASFQGPSSLLGRTSINALVTIHQDRWSGAPVNELVVRFNDGVDLSQAETIIAASGSVIKSSMNYDFLPMMLIIIPPNKSIQEMIDYFQLDPSVQYAERNDIVTLGRL